MQDHGNSGDGTAGVPAQAVVMAVLAVLFWASAIVVGRGLHTVVPPVGLTFWRSVLAAAILLPFAWPHLRADAATFRRRWKMLALMAAAMWSVGSTSMFVGLNYTTAVNAGLVNAAEPATIVLIAWLLYRDTVTLRQALGIAVSFCGIGVLILGGNESEALAKALAPRIGDLIVLLAVASWSLYVVLFHRYGREMHPMTMVFSIMMFGALELLPFYLLETAFIRPVVPDMPSVVTIVYLSVFASVLAVICWNRAILGIGHARTGLFIHLMPVFTILLAMIFLDETLRLYHIGGMVLIASGLYLTTAAKRASD